jgi:hypothetical protein
VLIELKELVRTGRVYNLSDTGDEYVSDKERCGKLGCLAIGFKIDEIPKIKGKRQNAQD